MTTPTNWIASELRRLRPRQFGRLERNERLSIYNRNYIPGNDRRVVGDWADWLAFYRRNAHRLKRFGGVFAVAANFKPNNPLHIVTAIESSIAKSIDIKAVYQKAFRVLRLVRSTSTVGLTPKEKLKVIFRAMQRAGLLRKRRLPLFTDDIKNTALGYTASTYLILSIAHEMRWPIYAVRVPHNIFVRWDKGRVKVNADRGVFHPDAYYIKKHRLRAAFRHARRLRLRLPYLRSLRHKGFVAIVMRMVGEAFYHQKNYGLANKYLSAALKLDNTFVRAFNIRGLARYFLGDSNGAVADFTAALKRNPEYGIAYHNRATAHLILRNYRRAIKDFDEALKRRRKNRHPLLLFSQSRAYFALGNYASALRNLMRVRALDPGLYHLHYQLGRVYLAQRNIPMAIKHLKLSLKRNGAEANTLFHLGRIHYNQQRYVRAVRFYNRAIKRDSKKAVLRFNRGLAYAKLRRHRAAIRDFHAALLIDKRYADAFHYSSMTRISWALWLKARGRFIAALAQYQRASNEQHQATLYNPRYRSPRMTAHIAQLHRQCAHAFYRTVHQKLLRAFNTSVNSRRSRRRKKELYKSALSDYRRALIVDPSKSRWLKRQISLLIKILRMK